jgi:hypothetical protein
MADIISFTPRPPKKPAVESNNPAPPTERAIKGTNWINEVLEASGELTTRDLVGAVKQALGGGAALRGRLEKLIQRDERRIREYVDMMRDTYTEEQIRAFLNPSDTDLRIKPFFFYAIADEAYRRGIFTDTV